jgi:hypothetical protein
LLSDSSAISVAISYIISVYCEDYAGYFTVILSFLAFRFCSAYFIYLVSCTFLAMLNLLDLSKFMNNPMSHDPSWPPIPTKLPLDILKLLEKNGEDPGDHATTFHLWCSSNSLNEDYI